MSDESHDIRDNMTVAEAARMLGITEGAVRKRVERGKLAAEHMADGRLLVYLDHDATTTDKTRDRLRPSRDERYTKSLEDQVQYLRGQLDQERDANRENRRIIAGLTQRIPELEAAGPSEPPEASQTAGEGPDRAEPRPATGAPQEGAQRRPWWRRVLGG
jgi:excisionase family DNA binding protein